MYITLDKIKMPIYVYALVHKKKKNIREENILAVDKEHSVPLKKLGEKRLKTVHHRYKQGLKYIRFEANRF